MTRHHLRAFFATFAAYGAWAVTPAFAQTAATGNDPEALESVTVTAQKRAQPLSDVPLSMQAFSGDSLQKSGVAELSDLVRFVPGMSEGNSNSYGFKVYQLRGTPAVTGDSTVAYYFDDVAFSIIGSSIAPVGRAYDLDRIEVLRGPQGTLYGLSALGGAIRFITANPDLNDFHFKAQAGYSRAKGGDPGNYEDAALNIPIVAGQLAARITVDLEHKGGYAEVSDFPNRKNLDPTRITNYRAKFLWEPNDVLRATFLAAHNEVRQDYGTLLVTADPPVGTQGTSAGLGAITNKYDLYALTFALDLGRATLESSSGYIEYTLDQLLYLNSGGPLKVTQSGVQDSFTQELRLVSKENAWPLDWVVGAFTKQAQLKNITVLEGSLNRSSPAQQKSGSYAAFSEISSKFLDGKLIPLIGLRYAIDEREYRSPGRVQDAKYHALTPRFNVSYFLDRDTLIYTNVARGERSGVFNNPALVPIVNRLGIPSSEVVRPDSLWSYEVGIKGDLNRGRFGYSISAYHSVWKDVQLVVTPVPGLGTTLNVGNARGNGVDYSFTWQAIRGLVLAFSGNFNDTQLHDLPASVANASPTDGFYNGARIPFTPRHTNAVSATLDMPLDTDSWRAVGFTAYSIAGNQFMPTSAGTSDVIRLLSARAGVRRKNVEVVLFGDNLTDTKAANYRDLGLINRVYPRTVGVQASVEY